jgi:hypothetical protein
MIAGGKHVVVHPPDGSPFRLPHGHGIAIDDTTGYVTLAMPAGGTVYELAATEETESEVVVSLGREVTRWKQGYPLPLAD